MKILPTFIVLFIFSGLIKAQKPPANPTKFYPAQIWKDTRGLPIDAHGGGVMYHNGIIYSALVLAAGDPIKLGILLPTL